MFKAIKNYFKYELGPAVINIPWKKIPPSTYVGWVMAILLSLNSILMMFGVSPINYNEDSVAKVVTLIVNVLVLIVNTYNNNSTSREAVLGDKIVTALKLADESGKKDAVDKINIILSNLNNDDAYITIAKPNNTSDDEGDAADTDLEDETTFNDDEGSFDNETSEEHTKNYNEHILIIPFEDIIYSDENKENEK